MRDTARLEDERNRLEQEARSKLLETQQAINALPTLGTYGSMGVGPSGDRFRLMWSGAHAAWDFVLAYVARWCILKRDEFCRSNECPSCDLCRCFDWPGLAMMVCTTVLLADGVVRLVVAIGLNEFRLWHTDSFASLHSKRRRPMRGLFVVSKNASSISSFLLWVLLVCLCLPPFYLAASKHCSEVRRIYPCYCRIPVPVSCVLPRGNAGNVGNWGLGGGEQGGNFGNLGNGTASLDCPGEFTPHLEAQQRYINNYLLPLGFLVWSRIIVDFVIGTCMQIKYPLRGELYVPRAKANCPCSSHCQEAEDKGCCDEMFRSWIYTSQRQGDGKVPRCVVTVLRVWLGRDFFVVRVIASFLILTSLIVVLATVRFDALCDQVRVQGANLGKQVTTCDRGSIPTGILSGLFVLIFPWAGLATPVLWCWRNKGHIG